MRGRAVIQAGLTVTASWRASSSSQSHCGDQLFQITYSSQCGLRSGVSGVPAERRLSRQRVATAGTRAHVLGPVPTLGHIPPARWGEVYRWIGTPRNFMGTTVRIHEIGTRVHKYHNQQTNCLANFLKAFSRPSLLSVKLHEDPLTALVASPPYNTSTYTSCTNTHFCSKSYYPGQQKTNLLACPRHPWRSQYSRALNLGVVFSIFRSCIGGKTDCRPTHVTW